ncbi:hypothetical protein [Nocardia arthritidis]|uniref:Uncharacterized protein n=1 Tax=Nocardia arthritidis TaxID=228602 RepID=A0A6G9Y6Q5_9NOCA|nr:hypothetical protein [Nocardia arthritidis]QIS08879.1 hypothetical protein F5544_04830 [Nocardia arthritidis]
MRIRNAVTVIGIAAGGALMAAVGAGDAAAIELHGPKPVGVNSTIRLSHEDTVELSKSKLAAVLSVPLAGGLYKLDPDSTIPDNPRFTNRLVTFADVVGEAAAAPNGSVDILLVDPAQWRGSGVAVEQFLN